VRLINILKAFIAAIILSTARILTGLFAGRSYYGLAPEALIGCALLLAVIHFNGKALFNGGRLGGFVKAIAKWIKHKPDGLHPSMRSNAS
jgi:hypothetical protein